MIVFTLVLLHFIDNFFNRDLTLIFKQFHTENELWLLRDNFVGECLRNQISLWQFDTQKLPFTYSSKVPEVTNLGGLGKNCLIPTIRSSIYYCSLSCIKASSGHPALDPLWWPMHEPVSVLTLPAFKGVTVLNRICGKCME